MRISDVLIKGRCKMCGYVQPEVIGGDVLILLCDDGDCLVIFTCPKCAMRMQDWQQILTFPGIEIVLALFPQRVIRLPERPEIEDEMSIDDLIEFGLETDELSYRRITGREQDV